MTRLITEWISQMETEMTGYDNHLKKSLGLNLGELAAKSCHIGYDEFLERLGKHKIASVPTTSGLGVISTFSESVASIVRAAGGDCMVTEKADVDGMYEAVCKGVDILFMADDDRFMALNIKTGVVGDNNIATALGYSTALENMAGGLAAKKVLVLGYGIVGRLAAQTLLEKDAAVEIWDQDKERLAKARENGIATLENEQSIKEFEYILDATNQGGWLKPEMLGEKVTIAAPGIPLSLTQEAEKRDGVTVICDMLQIGTAVMLGLAI